jgi:hypothetical protein
MDLDDEELKATRDKFYHKEIRKKDIQDVVKRIIKSEEKENETQKNI